MQNRIEKKIQRMLLVGKHTHEIFEELTLYLFRKKISDEEKASILKFALNAGLTKDLLSVFADLFHDQNTIPWNLFLELITRSQAAVPREVVESVLKGIRRQEREDDLLMVGSWDKIDPRFAEIREGIENRRDEEFGQKKNQMYERLSFYRSQRMFVEEEKLLKIMARMFPNDSAVFEEMNRFQEANAHEIIAQSTRKDRQDSLIPELQKLSTAESIFLKNLKNFAMERVHVKKASAYNFAVMFRMMGQPKVALEIVELGSEDQALAWLEIDLLLEAKMDVQCLDKIHNIELRFCEDPETTFAATYARAKALNNLGESAKAIDLLRSILDVRPDYRSANSLLTEWAQRWV